MFCDKRGLKTMLKITVQNGLRPTTIRLEGKLSGPWVPELARAWAGLAGVKPAGTLTVDLCEVTFIDSAGKKLLSSLVDSGAQLRSAHLMTKYIVERIMEGCHRTGG
jgi:ABC-type transporter Mla MlaB component